MIRKAMVAFGLMAGMLASCNDAMAAAPIFTVAGNYVGGAAPTSKPSGNFSVKNNQLAWGWRISVKYGTIVNNTFTPLPAVAGGGLPAQPALPPPLLFGGVPGGAVIAAGPNAWAVPNAIVVPAGWPAPPAAGQPSTIFVQATIEVSVFAPANICAVSNTVYAPCP